VNDLTLHTASCCRPPTRWVSETCAMCILTVKHLEFVNVGQSVDTAPSQWVKYKPTSWRAGCSSSSCYAVVTVIGNRIAITAAGDLLPVSRARRMNCRNSTKYSILVSAVVQTQLF